MAKGHNDATRVLGVVRETIAQNTKSGAKIEQTYGQVFGLSTDGREASVYLAGSRELAASDGGVPEPSEGFRVPSSMTLSASDYVRVAMDERGHRWVEEFMHATAYPKVTIDHSNGRIAFGDGTAAPTNFLQVVGGAFEQTMFRAKPSSPINPAFEAYPTSDTGFRFQIQGNGVMTWGPGNGTTDVTVFRSGANVLETDAILVTTKQQRRGGTSFPVSPSANDLYYRVDLDMEFFYDGTRWLSTQLFTLNMYRIEWTFQSATVNDFSRTAAPSLLGGSDIWLEEHKAVVFIAAGGTALGASHKWVGNVAKFNSAATQTTIATVNVDSGASGVYREFITPIDALMNNGTTNYLLATDWTKTGTPGNIQFYEHITYRIVAT